MNDAPTATQPVISPTNPVTIDDLATSGSGIDLENDPVTITYDWRKDGTSLAVVNTSFDLPVNGTTADAVIDYSTHSNHGTLGDGTANSVPVWTNDGYQGGAYQFDGVNDVIGDERSGHYQKRNLFFCSVGLF